MQGKLGWILPILLILAGLTTWLLWPKPEEATDSTADTSASPSPRDAAVADAGETAPDASALQRSTTEAPVPEGFPPLLVPVETAPYHERLFDPAQPPQRDLVILDNMLEAFRDYAGGQNPVGTNEEIMYSLRGANEARVAFFPQVHEALTEEGGLKDRWGTPFFFHSESADQMSIRSAGPDGRLHTEDDLLYPRSPVVVDADSVDGEDS